METFSALLVICVGNSPATGEFPTQRPVTRSFDAFFDLRLKKRLSKRLWCWRFGTPSRPLWRHCNDRPHKRLEWHHPCTLETDNKSRTKNYIWWKWQGPYFVYISFFHIFVQKLTLDMRIYFSLLCRYCGCWWSGALTWSVRSHSTVQHLSMGTIMQKRCFW